MRAAQSSLGLPTTMWWTGGAFDLVQGMSGGDQHLLGRTAAVRAGAAGEVAGLDHRDRKPGAAYRTGDADACIAAAEDDDVEFFGAHGGNFVRIC